MKRLILFLWLLASPVWAVEPEEMLADPMVQKFLDGAAPKKLIVVPGRIVNVVV